MTDLSIWKDALSKELFSDIIPYWSRIIGDGKRIIGRIDGNDIIHPQSEIGAVMAFRMLWAFSSAAGVDMDGTILDLAHKTYRYVTEHFLDRKNGGVWWSLDCDGNPLQRKKQSYATGFAIYGLSEYAIVTGNTVAAKIAKGLFNDLEKHAWDEGHFGYIEALEEDWAPIKDKRLSDKDQNSVFSMNSHLHIIEPYTNLYRLTHDPEVKAAIERLLDIFADRIYAGDGHLGLFFDEDWTRLDTGISYGHDIEASWLLDESMEVIGETKDSWLETSLALAEHTVEGLQSDGSLIYSKDIKLGVSDMERHWWVQCECAVGMMNLYGRTGDGKYLGFSRKCWDFIEHNLVDRVGGEWFWSIFPDGSVNRKDDKAGFWKCPYHNTRMCIELVRRINSL